jgi:hypothetical protein
VDAKAPVSRDPAGRRAVLLAWGWWGLFALAMLAVALLDQLLRGAGRPDLVRWSGAGAVSAILSRISAATIGAIVASRRPRNPVGWLLLAYGFLITFALVAQSWVALGLARSAPLPGTDAAVVLLFSLNYSGAPVLLLAFILLLTPTGALPSRRWRWLAFSLIALAVISILASPLQPDPLEPPLQQVTSPFGIDQATASSAWATGGQVLTLVVNVGFPVTILGAVVSLVVRFARARGVERRQLRWLALVAILAVVAVIVAEGAHLMAGSDADPVVSFSLGTITWLIPVALGAAVLRYRLYDLDRILSRTVAYGLLTLLLGGVYALVVLLLGQRAGQGSSLVVAAATLAVAAVFQPARRRVQVLVDRRFDRRRYDAARTVAAFSTRLRDEVALDTLSAEILSVVDQTVQPTRTSLWLRS